MSPFVSRFTFLAKRQSASIPGSISCRWLLRILLFLLPLPVQAQCPALESFYSALDQGITGQTASLRAQMPQCLDSAEYFALLGAFLLRSNQLPEALEALERALLIDPDNGAAQVDYAEGLYRARQIFPALEINARLLARTDLPAGLQEQLQLRQQLWQQEIRGGSLQAEVSAGYDSNLNGAPGNSEITLTLSGESVTLSLDPDFRPKEGGYLNSRMLAYYRALSPAVSHEVLLALRSRNSESSDTDLLQFDGQYVQTRLLRRYQLSLALGFSELGYGGSPLYSVADASASIRINGSGCRPVVELQSQIQRYHGQSLVSGIESVLGAGFDCREAGGSVNAGFSLGYLNNQARNQDRPGGDREGWRLQLYWQKVLGIGTLQAVASFAGISDNKGYSSILDNGAIRDIRNRNFRLQYNRQLGEGLTALINFSYQNQGSNIKPFENRGYSGEFGIRKSF